MAKAPARQLGQCLAMRGWPVGRAAHLALLHDTCASRTGHGPLGRLLPQGCVQGSRALAAVASEEKGTGQNAVVLSKRLPKDFVENTLLPHIESQLLDSIHVYTPAELAQISRAYAKQDVRQRVLCKKL